MSEWSRAPLALRVFIVISVGSGFAIAVVAHNAFGAFAVVITLATAYLLLKGFRVVWIIVTGLYVLSFVTFPFVSGVNLRAVVGSILCLVLLLVPETRRYFAET